MQSRKQIDGSKIKRALSQVHLAERSSTHADGISRVKAAKHAISDHALNADESEVLLCALHVQKSEIDNA